MEATEEQGNEGVNVETMTHQEAEEYITRTVAQRLAAVSRTDNRQSPIANNQSMSVDDPTSLTVGEDGVQPWTRRDVRYLHALGKAFRFGGDRSPVTELERSKPTESEMAAQFREAGEIIRGANLPRFAVQRIMSTLSQAGGAGLLSKPFLAELFVLIETYGKARKLARWITMTSDEVDLKNIASKPTWAYVDQNGKIPATGFTLTDDDKLKAYKGGALVPWTSELAEDQAIEFLPMLIALLAEAKAKAEDAACFVADGTSTYKTQTGILHAASNVVTMASGATSFSAVTADDFSKLYNSVSERSKEGAIFGIHSSIWGVVERLKGSDGQYIVQRPTEASKGRWTMFGFPVEFLDVMPALADTAVSKKFAFFGNPIYSLNGARREFEISYHPDGVITDNTGAVTYSAMENDGVVLRATQRTGTFVPTGMRSAFASLRTAAS